MSDRPNRLWQRVAVLCILIGTLLRLALAAISIGTNDAGTWYKIATYSRHAGLIQAYSESREFNHPLLPVLWAQLASVIGDRFFAFVFKLPFIAADAGSAWVAAQMAARLRGARAAKLTAAAVAFSPIVILISAYHCNSDSGYVFLVLLAVDRLMRSQFFFAGLALGGAINVKLIPLMFIPAAFAACRSLKNAGRLFWGLLLCVLPFVLLLMHPQIVRDNMIQYSSSHDRWGIYGFAIELVQQPQPGIKALAKAIADQDLWIGRLVIVLLVLLVCGMSWKRQRWSPTQLFLIVTCLFFIFTPGFGLQYLALPLPLIAVMSLTLAWQYSVVAGLFAAMAYLAYLMPGPPFWTNFTAKLPESAALFGWITWGLLLQIGSTLIFRTPACGEALATDGK